MKVLITDLTRMRGGHICAAGIDIDKNRRVRPVASAALSSRLLATNGGPLDLRCVVDIGRTAPRYSRPEVEDVRFEPRSIKPLSTMPGPEFLQRLAQVAASDLGAIGPDLRQEGRNLVVPEGKGKCSLVVVRTTSPLVLSVNAEGRLRLRWQDDVDLPITDLRLFKSDLRTPDASKIAWLQAQVRDLSVALRRTRQPRLDRQCSDDAERLARHRPARRHLVRAGLQWFRRRAYAVSWSQGGTDDAR